MGDTSWTDPQHSTGVTIFIRKGHAIDLTYCKEFLHFVVALDL